MNDIRGILTEDLRKGVKKIGERADCSCKGQTHQRPLRLTKIRELRKNWSRKDLMKDTFDKVNDPGIPR